jgi:hypothetical protein
MINAVKICRNIQQLAVIQERPEFLQARRNNQRTIISVFVSVFILIKSRK